jgi:hypothetical protein
MYFLLCCIPVLKRVLKGCWEDRSPENGRVHHALWVEEVESRTGARLLKALEV